MIPDPVRRGHPTNRPSAGDPKYGVRRYVYLCSIHLRARLSRNSARVAGERSSARWASPHVAPVEVCAEHRAYGRRHGSSIEKVPHPNTGTEQMTLVRASFSLAPNVVNAAEVVSAAYVYGKKDEAAEAARWFLDRRESVSKDLTLAPARQIFVRDLPSTTKATAECISVREQAHRVVARNRKRLRKYPLNIARWLDLSRAYAVLGLPEQAWQSMKVASGLAPNHRVVERVRARLLVHMNRTDEAHSNVLRNPALATDPWLMALEITLAQILKQMSRKTLAIRSGLHKYERLTAGALHRTCRSRRDTLL